MIAIETNSKLLIQRLAKVGKRIGSAKARQSSSKLYDSTHPWRSAEYLWPDIEVD